MRIVNTDFYMRWIVLTRLRVESKYVIPIIALIAGVIACTQLRNFTEALLFLVAAFAQFVAYVFVSRLRQRGSFFWHVVASLASNGTFYAVMSILHQGGTYQLLILPYLAGLIAGRTSGVLLAQYVEQRYKLEADATRDPN